MPRQSLIDSSVHSKNQTQESRVGRQPRRHGIAVSREHGFTLIELLVFIAIIGVLIGIFRALLVPPSTALRVTAQQFILFHEGDLTAARATLYSDDFGNLYRQVNDQIFWNVDQDQNGTIEQAEAESAGWIAIALNIFGHGTWKPGAVIRREDLNPNFTTQHLGQAITELSLRHQTAAPLLATLRGKAPVDTQINNCERVLWAHRRFIQPADFNTIQIMIDWIRVQNRLQG